MPRTEFAGVKTRREFLYLTGSLAAGGVLPGTWHTGRALAGAQNRLKVAAIITEFTHRSHAHVILENFLEPYLFNGRQTNSGMDVVGFYVDQFPARDMARDVAEQYKIQIYPTIAGALCLGGERLGVDAVLSIGEHGNYPVNAKGQREYPRKRFFDQIVAVFKESGRVAPVFNDKHLSYRWDWAREMVETARNLSIPFMAGSSVPLAQRRPPLEIPPHAKIREAVSIHGGPVESYDFHGLEVLQSMVELREGAESGVQRVQFWDEEALWKAADAGHWSPALAEAAMAAELGAGQPPLRELVQSLGRRGDRSIAPHAIQVTYRDGLRATVLKVGTSSTRWNFACQLLDEAAPRATSFYTGPWQNRNLFKALAHAIQVHFRQRQAPYPVERTLLVTGILDFAMESRIQSGKAIDTPELAVAYTARDFHAMREMGESWNIITEDTPEPAGINPGGKK